MSQYDVIIIGAGPGGIFAAYELVKDAPQLKDCGSGSGKSSGEKKMSD